MVEIPEDEEEFEEMAECPTCGATIPLDALVCPNCGQEFEEEEEYEEAAEEPEALFEESMVEEPVEEETFGEEEIEYEEIEEETSGEEEMVPEEEEGVPEEELVEEESLGEGLPPLTDVEEEELAAAEAFDEEKPAKMFWMGFILTLLGFFGGPVLSYLHDALRIRIGMFIAFEKFGWVNWTVAIVGMVITIIGLFFLFWGYIKIKRWRERIEAMLESPEPPTDVID